MKRLVNCILNDLKLTRYRMSDDGLEEIKRSSRKLTKCTEKGGS